MGGGGGRCRRRRGRRHAARLPATGCGSARYVGGVATVAAGLVVGAALAALESARRGRRRRCRGFAGPPTDAEPLEWLTFILGSGRLLVQVVGQHRGELSIITIQDFSCDITASLSAF